MFPSQEVLSSAHKPQKNSLLPTYLIIVTFILWYHKCMNDDNQNVNQNTPPPPVAQTDQTQPQIQPVAPVGSVNKEVGPVVSPVSESVKLSETEPRISQELKDLGIEAKKDEPNITDEHRSFIDHAKQFTPVSSSSSGKITMPMSEEDISRQLKTGQNDDSGKWLAWLLKKVIKWGFSNQ